MKTFLSINNLNAYYGEKKALSAVQLEIYQNQIIGVVGHNGAGKSTLFKSILGINKNIEGEINFSEIDFNLKNDIGYLPEERGLFDKVKVKEQLLYFGYLKGKDKKFLLQNIEFWATYFKVEKYLDQKLYTLSKGNQQKIQFIISILHNPKLLILDEPFSGLDPVNSDLFLNAIRKLNKSGITILYSSHKLESVEDLSDKVIFIKEGEIIYYDTLDKIKGEYPLILEVKNSTLTSEKLANAGFHFENEMGIFRVFIKKEEEAEQIYDMLETKFCEQFYIRTNDINDIFKDIYENKGERTNYEK
jgi:ABC-type uncharacterized transport system, ATPase component